MHAFLHLAVITCSPINTRSSQVTAQFEDIHVGQDLTCSFRKQSFREAETVDAFSN